MRANKRDGVFVANCVRVDYLAKFRYVHTAQRRRTERAKNVVKFTGVPIAIGGLRSMFMAARFAARGRTKPVQPVPRSKGWVDAMDHRKDDVKIFIDGL